MNQQPSMIEDTKVWVFQSWTAFVAATVVTLGGMLSLPLDVPWRAFMVLGFLFSISSSFTLAKTLRDRHEAQKVYKRIEVARAEEILRRDAESPAFGV